MLIDDYINIKVVSQNINHYKSLGYDCKSGEIITVKYSQLCPTSKKKEKRKCDNCGNIYERQHNYNFVTFNGYGIDVCPQCNLLEEFKNIRRKKVEDTNLCKYGTKAPLQNSVIQAKQKPTMKERYGVEYPGLSQDIMNKVMETNNIKYGGNTPMSNKAIVEKVRNTLYKNNNVQTSSQQLKIADNLINYYKENAKILINFPVSTTSLDIALFYEEYKIDIEYDGSYWHQNAQKDRRRDEFIKSKGYKVLRIRSGHLCPTIEQLIKSIDDLINNSYCFKEIILSDWDKNKKQIKN